MALLDDAIAGLTVEVAREKTVTDSAIVYIKGVPGLIQTAVDAALAAGATPAQLKAITDLQAGMKDETDSLVAALQPPAGGGGGQP